MPAKSNRSFHRSASLKLALPATSANLGPAFDTAALALGLFLKIRAHVSDQFSITARGRDADLCAQLENHLILMTYSEILQRESKRIQPLALHIENEIPIGKGCGSSAAARLAGIALAVHFGALRWDDARIVGEASRRGHHPDNAAACWYGGLAIARITGVDGAGRDSGLRSKRSGTLDADFPRQQQQRRPNHYENTCSSPQSRPECGAYPRRDYAQGGTRNPRLER